MADTTAAITVNNSYVRNCVPDAWTFRESLATDFTVSGGTVSIQNENGAITNLDNSKRSLRIDKDVTPFLLSPNANYSHFEPTQGENFIISWYTYQTAVIADIRADLRVYVDNVLKETIRFTITPSDSGIYKRFFQVISSIIIPFGGGTVSYQISIDDTNACTFWFSGLAFQKNGNFNTFECPAYQPPQPLVRTQGIYRYANSLAAQSITGGAWTTINNNGLAAETYKNRIFGVSELWNTSTNRGDLSGLELGDTVEFSFEADLTTTTANDIAEMRLILAQGTATERTRVLLSESDFKTAGTRTISGRAQIVLSDNDVKNNPFRVELRTGANSTFLTKNFLVIAQKTRIPC